MKKLATAITAVALIGTPAFAQAPPPAPVYNWTGWYAGVNAGASFGSVKTDFNGAPIFANGAQITSGFGFSDREYPDGFIGGGQIGYNWQYSPLIVVGLEADFQGALEKVTNNFGPQVVDFANDKISECGILAGFTTPCTATGSNTTQIDWFGTVRARIGYVWGNGEVMSYLTGGLAYGEVKINGTNTVSGEAICGPCESELSFSRTQTFGHSQINTGWVVGYGTEGHLPLMPGNWTWKVESLWMDLGTVDATSVTTASSKLSFFPGFLTGGQVTTHSHFTDGILRGGLNYKFY
jgi:outer membrane immunogenic protein